MNVFRQLFAASLLALLVGCGGATVSDNPQSVEQVVPPVKTMLEGVANSGELGSGAMEIRDALDKMKADGDAKADELLNDMTELEKASSPAAIKKKAAEMAAKL